MMRNANPFQTYFERDLHCFKKNNVKTLHFSKIMIIFAPKNSDMSIKGVITGDIVDSTSIPIEKREGLLECMSSVLDDIMQYFCSLEGSSSGKHDKKSCSPSEVNIIRKMTLTQFNLHYR